MSASKLFTPVLRRAQGTQIQETERMGQFLNPPTHPEIPFFSGPASGGEACYPLSLGGAKGTSTKPNKTRPISAQSQETFKY